jgi:hypothetical protein
MALRHEKRLLQKSEINLGREGCQDAANFPEVRNEIVALKKLEQEQKEVALRIAKIEEAIKKIQNQRQENTKEQNAALAKLEEAKWPLVQSCQQAKAAVDLCERELNVAMRNQQAVFDAAGEGIVFVRNGKIEGPNRALARIEQKRLTPARQLVNLGLRKSGSERNRRMMAVFVVGAVEDGDDHDDQLAVLGRQLALLADDREQLQPGLGHLRAIQQHPVQIQHFAAALGANAVSDRLELRIGVIVYVRYARHLKIRDSWFVVCDSWFVIKVGALRATNHDARATLLSRYAAAR